MNRNFAAMGDRQPVTLKEVADAAGVSISTVSRILDERTPHSRSASAERVRHIAQSMGYRRNVFASVLRRGTTGTIGVVVPRLSDTVMALMYEALERAAKLRGYGTIVVTSGDDAEGEKAAAETLLNRSVEGLILASTLLGDTFPQVLDQAAVPYALVLRTDGKSPSSLGDDETGGYLAVRHLIDLGHRDIALVTGPAFASTARDRLTGARRALLEAGLALPEDRVAGEGYRIEHGIAAAQLIFQARSEKPTAVFAANDNLALGVMSTAHKYGMQIGRDLALVGYNDIPLAETLPVPLTSVRVPFDQIATTAFELLLSSDQKNPIRRALPTLIPRASSGEHVAVN
jgi:LacI family transcriptional regulator